MRLDLDTGGALDYECMRVLSARLPEAVERFKWDGVALIAKHADERSAIYRAVNSEIATFSSDVQRSELLAAIHDILAKVFCKENTDPQLWPRPNASKGEHYGTDAIPTDEFNAWYYKN